MLFSMMLKLLKFEVNMKQNIASIESRSGSVLNDFAKMGELLPIVL